MLIKLVDSVMYREFACEPLCPMDKFTAAIDRNIFNGKYDFNAYLIRESFNSVVEDFLNEDIDILSLLPHPNFWKAVAEVEDEFLIIRQYDLYLDQEEPYTFYLIVNNDQSKYGFVMVDNNLPNDVYPIEPNYAFSTPALAWQYAVSFFFHYLHNPIVIDTREDIDVVILDKRDLNTTEKKYVDVSDVNVYIALGDHHPSFWEDFD